MWLFHFEHRQPLLIKTGRPNSFLTSSKMVNNSTSTASNPHPQRHANSLRLKCGDTIIMLFSITPPYIAALTIHPQTPIMAKEIPPTHHHIRPMDCLFKAVWVTTPFGPFRIFNIWRVSSLTLERFSASPPISFSYLHGSGMFASRFVMCYLFRPDRRTLHPVCRFRVGGCRPRPA